MPEAKGRPQISLPCDVFKFTVFHILAKNQITISIIMAMTNIYFRLSPKTFAICAFVLTILLCIYYASYITDIRHNSVSQSEPSIDEKTLQIQNLPPLQQARVASQLYKGMSGTGTCPVLMASEADVNTVEIFKEFEFQPAWMKTKEYWDKSFEDRYERQKMDSERPPLKVIIVPHSHNDPGWLKTFENYFNYQSRQIMNNMIAKLNQYQNLTFIWSEVAFLNAWWEVAHPTKRKLLKTLVKSGRLEVTTGGWVMTDEANCHLFAMVDQLVEGHQWLLRNLDVKPKSGWSIDPFGQGFTQPFLASQSGISGTIIQRIHYAWKQWLALKQYGDFKWIPNWSSTTKVLTHNQPFDIYSIKHSCGPHPSICLNFDFRKIQGEYTEYSIRSQPITDKNVKEKSELLLEQYARTGSLFPHNVVLMPLGDDFRYSFIEEWDQQYTNYIKLINYINANKATYKTEIAFGTPKDYFIEIQKRFDQFPTLKGDFFVYSDIFSEGSPAYWSGFYTTRPFMKILDRELESSLRGAEILYTIALNNARKHKLLSYIKVLERNYEKLVQARRSLALFQHHDAITGTSKSFVMRDYALKLFMGLQDTTTIQQTAIQSLLFGNAKEVRTDQIVILSDLERDSFEKLPKKTPILVEPGRSRQIVLYNSLAQPQDHLIQVRITASSVKVIDNNGQEVICQINPVWHDQLSLNEFELIFVAKLPALSLITYTIIHQSQQDRDKMSIIYCTNCIQEGSSLETPFKIRRTQIGDIQLENHKLKILFNGDNGFMKTITNKLTQKITQSAIQFAAYRSAQFHSGAYLFMPDPNERDVERDILSQYKEQMNIIITSGLVTSELTVIYKPFLTHTVRIFHIEESPLSDIISIQNEVDFENPPKNRESELFMRIVSDLQNGDPPEFYTDCNGFQMQKRVKVERIGIEGNYFPITTMAYIQDEMTRLSLVTNHAQGAASWQPGYLEVMLDRRTLYDDSRGMGEGLVDNRPTVYNFWLLLEEVKHININGESLKRFENENSGGDDPIRTFNIPANDKKTEFSRPSLFANQISNALNYPVGVFIIEDEHIQSKINPTVRLLNKQLPCDLHLLNLRTQPDYVYNQFPSDSALAIFHKQGYDCSIHYDHVCRVLQIQENTNFEHVSVRQWKATSLTGTSTQNKIYTDLSDVVIEPMMLQTFNVTFS